MTDTKTEKKTNWRPTIISILIGIVIAMLTTWYSINSSKQEAEKAEMERVSKVKDNIVSIIEEHIVNKDTLDLDILNRLIYNRTREENLYRSPTIFDLISLAEYNIQNSKHLSFEKKKDYSKVLDVLFERIISDTKTEFSEYLYSENANQLLKYIEETKRVEAKNELVTLLEKYENKIKELETSKTTSSSFLKEFLSADWALTFSLSMLVYALVLLSLRYYSRMKRRKREYHKQFLDAIENEREKIKQEIEYYYELLEQNDVPKNKKQEIKERIDKLYQNLEDLESNYYRQHQI